MKIVVVGDTHGKTERIKKRLKLMQPDYLFFTGDHYQDGLNIAHNLGLSVVSVVGNCDSRTLGPQEEIITLGEKRFLIVHGHQYGVKKNLNRLYYRGQEVEADVVVFGHTHLALCKQIGDMWLLNPGSPSLPRLTGKGSYALIDLDQGGIFPSIIPV